MANSHAVASLPSRSSRSERRLVIVAAFVVAGQVAPGAAQTPDYRRDLGATITWLNLNDLSRTAGGLGGRIGTHVVDLLWLDAEANVFPTDDPLTGRKLWRSTTAA